MRLATSASLIFILFVPALFAESAAPPAPASIGPAQRRVPPETIYHRVFVISPLVGSGQTRRCATAHIGSRASGAWRGKDAVEPGIGSPASGRRGSGRSLGISDAVERRWQVCAGRVGLCHADGIPARPGDRTRLAKHLHPFSSNHRIGCGKIGGNDAGA